MILEGQIEIGKGGGTTWNASLSIVSGEGKGKGKERTSVHHQAKGQTFQNTGSLSVGYERFETLMAEVISLVKNRGKKTHHRWLSWNT